jgi:hypothetical protein
MPSVAVYMQRLQRILGDQMFQRFNEYDLLEYINEARVFVALEGACCRGLVPSTAGLSFITVTNGGSGYTSAPTVTVQAPQLGTQAGAAATISGGQVVYVQVTNPGSGYSTFNVPGVSFAGGGGSGAAATASLMPFCQAVQGQEVYNHKDFNPILKGSPATPGLSEIVSITSCAVSWGSMKPMMRWMEWGDFQAYLRSYNVAAQGFPRVWSPFSSGSEGSFYLWPIPAQNAQMDLDCICIPTYMDLTDNSIIDAVPQPWDRAVPYKAAAVAVTGMPDMAGQMQMFEAQYDARMRFASYVGNSQTRIPDYYNSAAMA